MPEESTTPDLVERTRLILDAADRADFDAILEFYAHDAVWELRAGGTFHGVDAIRDLWKDYYRPYEDFGIDVEVSYTSGEMGWWRESRRMTTSARPALAPSSSRSRGSRAPVGHARQR